MKIAILLHDYSQLGGVEKVSANLAKAFIDEKMPFWGILSLEAANDVPKINYPKEIMWIGQQSGQFPITRNVVHYARVRYNSSDSKTSEWSDTLAFKMVGVDSTSSS